MKKKQFLALALSAVMAGGMLAGCGSSNGSSSSSKSDAKDEVVTLKWIQVGNGMPKDYDEWLAQINPYLEEKIGVNVDMEIVPWGDWDNRRSVITNSGEYFDILFTDQNRYSSEVNTGALMDITDLLKDNASELYDMIPEDYWKAVEVNGKIYGVPTYKDSSLSEYFVWDQDIADKYNIDVNSVTDFNTLYDALKTVKEGEGGSPYFMSKNGANFLLNLNYDDLSSGLPAIGVKYGDDSKTVVNPLDDEEILSNLDIVRKMYQEGIINGDAPTADDSSKYAMFFVAQGMERRCKNNMGSEQWYRQLFSSTVWQHSRFQHNCTWFHQWYLLRMQAPGQSTSASEPGKYGIPKYVTGSTMEQKEKTSSTPMTIRYTA